MFVYKIHECINNFYLYLISHLDDPDMVLEHFEHACAHKCNVDVNKYFNQIGWDVIGIEQTQITPIDFINNNLGNDDHCMNISQKFKDLITIEKSKAPRQPKTPKEPKEPKKAAKPRAKKSDIKQETTPTA